jgi:hypothetical protein
LSGSVLCHSYSTPKTPYCRCIVKALFSAASVPEWDLFLISFFVQQLVDGVKDKLKSLMFPDHALVRLPVECVSLGEGMRNLCLSQFDYMNDR